MSNQTDFYFKVESIIKKFKNGKELYNKSAVFNRVIQMLARDCNEYEVIEQLIIMLDDNQKAFEQYILRDTRPINFNLNDHKIN